MDIYARSGKLDEAEALFENTTTPDVVRNGVLIKAYGNSDHADRATFHIVSPCLIMMLLSLSLAFYKPMRCYNVL
jgi:hypothetical protein